jgi:hypothetical protein
MSEHIHEHIESEKVDAPAREVTDARLRGAEKGSGIALGHSRDYASELQHQHRAWSEPRFPTISSQSSDSSSSLCLSAIEF